MSGSNEWYTAIDTANKFSPYSLLCSKLSPSEMLALPIAPLKVGTGVTGRYASAFTFKSMGVSDASILMGVGDPGDAIPLKMIPANVYKATSYNATAYSAHYILSGRGYDMVLVLISVNSEGVSFATAIAAKSAKFSGPPELWPPPMSEEQVNSFWASGLDVDLTSSATKKGLGVYQLSLSSGAIG